MGKIKFNTYYIIRTSWSLNLTVELSWIFYLTITNLKALLQTSQLVILHDTLKGLLSNGVTNMYVGLVQWCIHVGILVYISIKIVKSLLRWKICITTWIDVHHCTSVSLSVHFLDGFVCNGYYYLKCYRKRAYVCILY